jgi:hypothetical protein
MCRAANRAVTGCRVMISSVFKKLKIENGKLKITIMDDWKWKIES